MASSSKVSLKLLIDVKSKKVLFAEASKEFIDFLFNLLRLPIGTVIRLLTKSGMVGSLGKIYESVENLGDTYLLQPEHHKKALLKPNTVAETSGLLLPANDDDDDDSDLYMCPNRCGYNVTRDVNNTRCPSCRNYMKQTVSYVGKEGTTTKVSADSFKDGFVKGVVTYMVMDDLVVQPMSTISSITLLNEFNVKEVGSLQEKMVELGMEEVIMLYYIVFYF